MKFSGENRFFDGMFTLKVDIEKSEDVHFITIEIKKDKTSKCILKNYPCKAEKPNIWIGTIDEESKIMLRIFENPREFENWEICLEYWGEKEQAVLIFPDNIDKVIDLKE